MTDGRLRAALFVLLVAAAACQPAVPPQSYLDRLAADRAAKDTFFRTSSDSPILPAERDRFLPLSYFPIDEGYVAAATLAPSEAEPAMEMPTSTGLRRPMRRAGALKFSLRGAPLQLTAFVDATTNDMNRLFVPFGDRTNGTETYAAGRYLDLDRAPSGLYQVDFNRAYHPYCFYNDRYDCPYPPPENRLEVPVRAGERA